MPRFHMIGQITFTAKPFQQDAIFENKRINFKHTNSAEEPFRHDMVKTHENQVEWNTSQDEDDTVQRLQRCFVEWCYYQVNWRQYDN